MRRRLFTQTAGARGSNCASWRPVSVRRGQLVSADSNWSAGNRCGFSWKSDGRRAVLLLLTATVMIGNERVELMLYDTTGQVIIIAAVARCSSAETLLVPQ